MVWRNKNYTRACVRTKHTHPSLRSAERSVRVQEQAVGMKRFGEDLITLQQRIDAEKLARDAEVSSLRAEVHDVLGNRNASDEQFRVSAGWQAGTHTQTCCRVYVWTR